MTKKKWLVLVACVALAVSAIWYANKPRPDDMLKVSLAPVETPGGWGYEIAVDGHVFVRQEKIPAIAGNKSFKNKAQALLVGNLAVKKVVDGKMPVITKDELRNLNISE